MVSGGNVMLLQTETHKPQPSPRFSGLTIILVPTLFVLAATQWATFQANLPPSFFSRDPTSTLNGHPLTGMQSTLGVLVWCAAAGICFFSFLVLQPTKNMKKYGGFLLMSGVISSVLALDDMFLIHEDLATRYLLLDEKVVFLAYGSLIVWYVVKYRRLILDSRYVLLVLAFSFFASSIAVDVFQNMWPSAWRIFFEDGFKLLGIATWSGYLITTCLQAVGSTVALAPRAHRSPQNGP